MKLNSSVLEMMQCPITGENLHQSGTYLVTESHKHRYRINEAGIPLFAENFCSAEGQQQQQHYEKVASAYLKNLTFPHTQEYMKYLDTAFLVHCRDAVMDNVAEICCGRGEAFHLLGGRVKSGIGVDITVSMLESARRELPGENLIFIQGDATMLPLKNDKFDSIFMLGGVHHVNDRAKLFSEIFRILKPGGRVYWREPVSDFFLWRWLRYIVYRVSPALDADTERPLLYRETVPVLEKAGFRLFSWDTYGFVGFCFFMNSDILVFNRLFRYLPCIRTITRGIARLDDVVLGLPGLHKAGLQVIGVAEKSIGTNP